MVILTTAHEIEGCKGILEGEILSDGVGFHFGGGVAVKVEYDPTALKVWVKDSEVYFLLLMNDSVVAPMVRRLVHPKILDP